MTSRLHIASLERTLASLDSEAAEQLARAGHLAAAARDADRWGLQAEAEEAAHHSRRSRVQAVVLGALAAGVRFRIFGAHA